MVKPHRDSRCIDPDVLNVQRTCQGDARVHSTITRILYPIGLACFALLVLITVPLGGAWKGGRTVGFFPELLP